MNVPLAAPAPSRADAVTPSHRSARGAAARGDDFAAVLGGQVDRRSEDRTSRRRESVHDDARNAAALSPRDTPVRGLRAGSPAPAGGTERTSDGVGSGGGGAADASGAKAENATATAVASGSAAADVTSADPDAGAAADPRGANPEGGEAAEAAVGQEATVPAGAPVAGALSADALLVDSVSAGPMSAESGSVDLVSADAFTLAVAPSTTPDGSAAAGTDSAEASGVAPAENSGPVPAHGAAAGAVAAAPVAGATAAAASTAAHAASTAGDPTAATGGEVPADDASAVPGSPTTPAPSTGEAPAAVPARLAHMAAALAEPVPAAATAPAPDPAAASGTGVPATDTTAARVTTAGLTPVAAPAPPPPAPTAPAPTSPASAPMPSALPERAVATQLTAPITSLRAAGNGEHVMVVRVSPDTIGPVRVRAHIGAEGVRIELLGATEGAREALKVAMPDLRRDLIAAGFPADMSVSTGRQPTGSETGWAGGGSSGDPRTHGGRPTTPGRAAASSDPDPGTQPQPVAAGLRGLDITV